MLIRRGHRGDAVAALQSQLNEAAQAPLQRSQRALLVAGGIFGAGTQARVIEFQLINRHGRDGFVGPATQGTLDALVGPVQAWQPKGGSGVGGTFPKSADKKAAGASKTGGGKHYKHIKW